MRWQANLWVQYQKWNKWLKDFPKSTCFVDFEISVRAWFENKACFDFWIIFPFFHLPTETISSDKHLAGVGQYGKVSVLMEKAFSISKWEFPISCTLISLQSYRSSWSETGHFWFKIWRLKIRQLHIYGRLLVIW